MNSGETGPLMASGCSVVLQFWPRILSLAWPDPKTKFQRRQREAWPDIEKGEHLYSTASRHRRQVNVELCPREDCGWGRLAQPW